MQERGTWSTKALRSEATLPYLRDGKGPDIAMPKWIKDRDRGKL